MKLRFRAAECQKFRWRLVLQRVHILLCPANDR
jgi:hypothetical protein